MRVSLPWARMGAGPHAHLLGVYLRLSAAFPTQNSRGPIRGLPVPASHPRTNGSVSLSTTHCFLVTSSVCLSVCLLAFLLCEDLEGCPAELGFPGVRALRLRVFGKLHGEEQPSSP